MKEVFVILLLFKFSFTEAASVETIAYPKITKKGRIVEDFIPVGWKILRSSRGDLNGDRLSDLAVVIESKDSLASFLHLDQQGMHSQANRIEKYKRRILFIVFQRKRSGKYYLVEQSNSVILCRKTKALEDPFLDLHIENEMLHLFYLAKMPPMKDQTHTVYHFAYQKGEFILVRADIESFTDFPVDVLRKYVFDFAGQRWAEYSRNTTNWREEEIKWKPLNKLPVKSMKTFVRPYLWAVTENFYL